MSISSKEKKCVSITSEYIVPKEKPSLVRNVIQIIPGKDLFADGPIWLIPIILVIYIVCLPVTIVETFKSYFDEKNTYNELVEKFYKFNGFSGEKNIASLWHEYGLNPKKSILYKEELEELAICLSRWISILYERSYHISTEEILQRYTIQQKKQAKAYLAFKNIGGMVSFVDAMLVVVKDILDSLPNYSYTNGNEYAHKNFLKKTGRLI